MRKQLVFTTLLSAILLSAGPATKPAPSLDEVENQYRDRTTAAKHAYVEEMAKADAQRLAALQSLLDRATKSGGGLTTSVGPQTSRKLSAIPPRAAPRLRS